MQVFSGPDKNSKNKVLVGKKIEKNSEYTKTLYKTRAINVQNRSIL